MRLILVAQAWDWMPWPVRIIVVAVLAGLVAGLLWLLWYREL